MKIRTIIISMACMAFALGSCSGSDSKGGENQKLTEEEVTEAVNSGRTAARALINVSPTDTFGMQSKLLEARSIQSRYVSAGKKAQAEVFDTAFIHTLRAVRPDLAQEIEAQTH